MTSQNTQFLASAVTAPLAQGVAAHSIIKFVRFLAAGGFAALVNLVSRYLLTPIVGFQPSIAATSVIAYPEDKSQIA